MATETKVTMELALEILWAQKGPASWGNGKALRWVFGHLREPQTMSEWSGVHPAEANTTRRPVPAGTLVFVPMVSRMGDVGVRDRSMTPGVDRYDGYSLRVAPEALERWSVVDP